VTLLATLAPLQATAFVLVAAGATAVVLVRDPLRQALVNGFYGLVLVALFVILGAPDVALSMVVVSTVAYPFVILVAIARARGGRTEGGGTKGGDRSGRGERER
jgi:energy-converting hydrogenase B subunit D